MSRRNSTKTSIQLIVSIDRADVAKIKWDRRRLEGIKDRSRST